MKEQEYILIENYLADDLTAKELGDFEDKLRTDLEFRETFETYQQVSDQLKHEFTHYSEKEAVKKSIDKVANTYFEKKKEQPKKSSFKPWRIGVAAMILILVGIYAYQEFSTPVYSDYNQYPTVSFQSRGEESESLREAEEAFNSHQFAEAATHFEVLVKGNDNVEYKLYWAISLVETDQFEKADQLYLDILKSESVFVHEALWFGALSKLKQEDNKAASQLLSQIPEESDRYKEAQKLYKKLN
ncbi:tetratricopeptide repeat protein [Psychroflexus halocasei]|uniref:Tetratricopeptide repeat-containing protein n=1 Tax=Psychroflexus halocasei TaxID=908615 RepID=A0A1H4AJ41_9FLAO|nr:hypothetical protein [Psychroflexus halocasei]SEA35857.1 hypothetical protein SAMN05421540_10552 [Psychroflexus halocasei]